MGSPNEGTSIDGNDGNEGASKNDTTDALPGGMTYVFSYYYTLHTPLFFQGNSFTISKKKTKKKYFPFSNFFSLLFVFISFHT